MKFWLSYLKFNTLGHISKLDIFSSKLKQNCIKSLVSQSITQPKLHQIKDIGDVLESSGRADSKTVIGIPIWPRFDRENKETSWCISNEQYCTKLSFAIPLLFEPASNSLWRASCLLQGVHQGEIL